MMENEDKISATELQRRIVYSTFLPAVRLGRMFNMPLKEIKRWLSIAYLQEMKKQGLTQNEVAARFDVSRRTVIDLTKSLKENFFHPERHEGLHRRILFLLWAEPMWEGRLLKALSEFDERDVKNALEKLIGEDTIEYNPTQTTRLYKLKKNAFRLYKNNWMARVDALNHQLNILTDTVFGRFFSNDEETFVRNVGLSIREEDLEELEAFYQDVIFPKLVALDEASKTSKGAKLINFSISWVPQDLIKNFEKLNNKKDNV